jgi:hypothetical protein
VKQLQQFLCMVNFYRHFLPGIARTMQPLTGALQGDPKTLSWPPGAARCTGGRCPVSATCPKRCALSGHGRLGHHVGGVLQQLARGSWQPLAFFSKKLLGVGTRCSTFKRELLAAFWKGNVSDCSQTTSPWSHPFSAPYPHGPPANSDSCLSSPNSHQTSDTQLARRTWLQTP